MLLMTEMLTNPRKTKQEEVIELLKILPTPLFPRELEVLKICEKVKCHRATVYKARNELKTRHILLHQEAGVGLVEPKNVRNVTLRSVNHELMSHFVWFWKIMFEKMLPGIKMDTYELERYKLIERLLGVEKGEVVDKQ